MVEDVLVDVGDGAHKRVPQLVEGRGEDRFEAGVWHEASDGVIVASKI